MIKVYKRPQGDQQYVLQSIAACFRWPSAAQTALLRPDTIVAYVRKCGTAQYLRTLHPKVLSCLIIPSEEAQTRQRQNIATAAGRVSARSDLYPSKQATQIIG